MGSASRGPAHAACNSGRLTGQASYQDTGASSDQCTATHAILPRGRTSGAHQGHDGHDKYLKNVYPASPLKQYRSITFQTAGIMR